MIVAVLNQKGGSGKTTLALNIASCCSMLIEMFRKELTLGYDSVTLVDSDPQRTLTEWHAVGTCPLQLIAADRVSMLDRLSPEPRCLYILDGASKADDMCISSIKKADIVLVPFKPSPMDAWAIAPIINMLHARHQLTGKPQATFLQTMVNPRCILTSKVQNDFEKFYEGFDLLSTVTRDREIYKKSAMEGQSVFDRATGLTSSDRNAQKQARLEILLVALHLLTLVGMIDPMDAFRLAHKPMRNHITKEKTNEPIKGMVREKHFHHVHY